VALADLAIVGCRQSARCPFGPLHAPPQPDRLPWLPGYQPACAGRPLHGCQLPARRGAGPGPHRGEVIACAVGSPYLLLLPGIGPAGQLCDLDIGPAVDLPGVGHNLQDHPVALACCGAERELRRYVENQHIDHIPAAARHGDPGTSRVLVRRQRQCVQHRPERRDRLDPGWCSGGHVVTEGAVLMCDIRLTRVVAECPACICLTAQNGCSWAIRTGCWLQAV